MMSELTAAEIKEIREQYGLTQKSFAQLLGIGQASMVRYENGSEPSRANANLIRAARHPEFMIECIERDGDSIPVAQRDNAMRIAYACISLGPAEGEGAERAAARPPRFASKMDEVYRYTIQQEVLNEQAANLACDMMNYLIANGIDARDRSHPVSLLLAQLLKLKRKLITDEADDDLVLEQIGGYFKYTEEVMSDLMTVSEVT